jgi:hypothetical protein
MPDRPGQAASGNRSGYDEPPGPLYKAVIVGLVISYIVISYIVIAVTHSPGFAWIIPIPVAAAAAAAILIALTSRRR